MSSNQKNILAFLFIAFVWSVVSLAYGQKPTGCPEGESQQQLIFDSRKMSADVEGDSLLGHSYPENDTLYAITPRGTCAGKRPIPHDQYSDKTLPLHPQTDSLPGFKPGELISLVLYHHESRQYLEVEMDVAPCVTPGRYDEPPFRVCGGPIVWEENFFGVIYNIYTPQAIPVELVSFDVRADGADALLRWETASETNNAGYRVMADGEEVGFVEAQGAGTYQFRHKEAYGVTSYRLVQVDLDGTETVYGPVELNNTMPEPFIAEAPYPNPARGQAQMQVKVKQGRAVEVSVFNILGRVVEREEITKTQQIRIGRGNLPSGKYFIVLRSKEKVERFSLVMVR